MKNLIKFLIIFLISLILLNSCSAPNYDRLAREELYKRERGNIEKIFETKTKLELPLMTFGRDFAYIQQKRYFIGVYPLINETNSKAINPKIKRIMLSAIVKLSSSPIASSKLIFVDVNLVNDDFFIVKKDNFSNVPYISYGIEGSITEYENIIETYNDINIDATVGGGSTTTDAGMSFNKSAGIRILTLDLNFINKKYNVLIPLGYTSNSLVLKRAGKGNAFYLYILGNGFTLGRDIYVINSTSFGIRFLTEFSLIQLLGRIDNLPYWHCLKGENIKDKLIVEYMRAEWNKLNRKRKLLRYSKIAKLYFGYYVAPRLPVEVRGRITFDINRQEGVNNTIKMISILKKFYRMDKTDFDSFNPYYFLWKNSPFCSYPYDEKLDTFIMKNIDNIKFETIDKFDPIMAIPLSWENNYITERTILK